MMETQMFAAVRCDRGRLWLDPQTFSAMSRESKVRQEELDKLTPEWAAANPAVGVVEVLITWYMESVTR